jgi:hypothetical protein
MRFHCQLGGDFGQQGPSSAAPPPEQLRPSMADEIAASIFGDPNPGVHWTAPHDYAPDDQ